MRARSLSRRYESELNGASTALRLTECRARDAEVKAQQDKDKAQQAEVKAQQAEDKAQQAEDKAQQAEDKAQQAEDKAQQAEDKAQQAEDKAQQAEDALIAVYNSSSWKLTAPLRNTVICARKVLRFPKNLNTKCKDKIKLLLIHAKLYINRRPKLKRISLIILAPFPTLQGRLRQATMVAPPLQMNQPPVTTNLINISPHGRKIYVDLKTAIAKRQKEKN